MRIPIQLETAIDEEVQKCTIKTLAKAREGLSARYRSSLPLTEKFIQTEADRSAYLVSRMPATFAVVKRVFKEILQRLPGIQIRSLLDLGAGTGSVMWAAAELFPELTQFKLIEQDPDLVRLGKQLAKGHHLLKEAFWQIDNLEKTATLPHCDLVVFSYSIGELPADKILPLVDLAWQATQQHLVIIEPGTMPGFNRIRLIRDHLIRLGAPLIAPCPHADRCPMAKDDWCHFSQRLERTSLHRRIKEGMLGYEDEKFSYLVFSKQRALEKPDARIIRHPFKAQGHLKLALCNSDGITTETTISKRTPGLYKVARKLEWGDLLTRVLDKEWLI